jgi:hypothetical protein
MFGTPSGKAQPVKNVKMQQFLQASQLAKPPKQTGVRIGNLTMKTSFVESN